MDVHRSGQRRAHSTHRSISVASRALLPIGTQRCAKEKVRYLASDTIERRAATLLKTWSLAVNGEVSIPIDVAAIATDFFGLEIKFEDLESGIVAQFIPVEDVIVLDRRQNHNERRARFSIAHELGHVELHSELGLSKLCRDLDSSRLEIQANYFAGALLMPADHMLERIAGELVSLGRFTRRVVDEDVQAACRLMHTLLSRTTPWLSEEQLQRYADEFHVSATAMCCRLEQLQALARAKDHM